MNCEKNFMSVSELMEYTGMKKSFIYSLTHRRMIPHIKPTRKKLLFEKSQIDKWLEAYNVETENAVTIQAASFV